MGAAFTQLFADCDFYGKSDPQRIPGEVQQTEEHWKIFQAKIRIQLLLTGLPLFLCIVCTAAVCPLYLFAAIADDFSFYRFLCTAYGTGGAVPWSQNADIDMYQ